MKKILLGVGAVALFMGLFFFLTREKAVVIDVSTLPIITAEGGVTLKKEAINRPVMSPETVEAPFTLITEMGAQAIVTFPDGSELRASENSELVVDTATYTSENGGLTVHAKLTIGRVWSNIVALVTPESKWEVETSNVVATVRGTAFDMQTTAEGTTTITGSEHSIELTLVDPETGERDENRKMMLGEDEFVTIGTEDAVDTTRQFPTPKKRTDEQRNDPWMKKNEDRTEIQELKEETLGQESPLPTLGEDEEPVKEIELLNETPTVAEPVVKPVQGSVVTPPKPVSITVTPSLPLTGIIEGTPVNLSVTLLLSDNTKRDVSREVTWSVIGNVGSIQGTTLTPLLDTSVSEFGRAYGSLSATWKDGTTGATLQGASEIFEVKPRVTRLIEEG